MPCMPHFRDHFIPSTWVVLRKRDNPPAAAADVESALQEAETKLRAEFKQVARAILETLRPFNEAREAVRSFIAQKAAEELQALRQLNPQLA